jgi:lipoprotein-anchoring transpeptidase ErfK/SrfK
MKIHVSLARQTLEVFDDDDQLLRSYAVSTAKNGAGELSGSYCTPRGRHLVRAKLGHGAPANTVFVRRRQTGEMHSPELHQAHPGRDWILTRILWLSGRDSGYNRGRNASGETVDTMRRYVYIHGTPEHVAMGEPGSHGCIRMRNADVIELFDLIPVYTQVEIAED